MYIRNMLASVLIHKYIFTDRQIDIQTDRGTDRQTVRLKIQLFSLVGKGGSV